MSYTGTLAQSGLGTVFAINTGSVSSPTYTIIGEISSAPQSGRMLKTADATNLQSLAVEWIGTLIDSGSFDLTCNRVVGDVGQLAVETAFEAKLSKMFKVTLPLGVGQTTTGDAYSFLAVIEELGNLSDIGPDKVIQTKIKLKVSGLITFAAGS